MVTEGGRPSRQFRVRTLMLVIAVAAVGLGAALDPFLGPMIAVATAMFGVGLVAMLGAVALCWIGLGLFALGDRAVAWVRRVSRWPE